MHACVFDAYGTLFDVHAPLREHAAQLGDDAAAISQLWRTKQLEYTWLRSLMGRYVDFREVTADALDYALERYGVEAPQLRRQLLDAYLRLDTYPEVRSVLGELRTSGVPTGILSNGSPEMLASVVESADVGAVLDEVISVDQLGVYKPDPRVYQLAVDAFGLTPAEICFLSSNAWDAAGAASFGFQVVWVNRFAQPAERLGHLPDLQITELSTLPSLVLASRPG